MPTDQLNNTIQALHIIAEELMKEHKDDTVIVTELAKRGNITTEYASQILGNVYEDKHKRKEFWRHIILGSFITIGGLLVNLMSYQFLLIWGIVVVGIIILIRGFILFRK